MNTSEIEFRINGCLCRGFIFVPTGWTRPARLPAVVIVPGGSGLRSSPKEGDCGFGLLELAHTFTRNGFATVCYDGRGQGMSEGSRTGHNDTIVDLKDVLKILRTKHDVIDEKRIGLFGQSAGGMASVVVAAEDSEIRSLILWGTLPRYSLLKEELTGRGRDAFEEPWQKSGKQRPFEDFVRDFQVIDPVEYMAMVRQPILVAGGSRDDRYFRYEEQQQLVAAAKHSSNVMFLQVSGEVHRMRHWSRSFQMAAKLFVTWFSETI